MVRGVFIRPPWTSTPETSRRSLAGPESSWDRQWSLDPGPPGVRFEHGVGHELGVEAVEEAGDGPPALDDRGDELPGEVVAEDRGGDPFARVAGAARGLEEFGGDGDGGEVLAGLTQ